MIMNKFIKTIWILSVIWITFISSIWITNANSNLTCWPKRNSECKYYESANILKEYGIIEDKDWNRIELGWNNRISRAEFLTIVSKAVWMDTSDCTGTVFEDVNLNLWYETCSAIENAANLDLITKSRVNNNWIPVFFPKNNITREEYIAIFLNLTGVKFNKSDYSHDLFTDISKTQLRYHLNYAKANGIVNGIKQKNGTFRFEPYREMNRGEAYIVTSYIFK